MSKLGRPRKEIDWDEFDKLCGLQCTLVEIAEWFDCSEDTIERRVQEEYECTFAERYKKKAAKGKMSLRRKQIELALSGNVAMLIWLGKQYLGQRDKQDDGHSTATTSVIQMTTDQLLEVFRKSRGDE